MTPHTSAWRQRQQVQDHRVEGLGLGLGFGFRFTCLHVCVEGNLKGKPLLDVLTSHLRYLARLDSDPGTWASFFMRSYRDGRRLYKGYIVLRVCKRSFEFWMSSFENIPVCGRHLSTYKAKMCPFWQHPAWGNHPNNSGRQCYPKPATSMRQKHKVTLWITNALPYQDPHLTRKRILKKEN